MEQSDGPNPRVVPPRFKAFRITKEAKVESSVTNVALDDLTPGEVVVRTAFAGLNYKDALATTDHGRVIRKFPRIGGIDLTGVVISSTDSKLRPGDQVMALGHGLGVDEDGGFSEYARLRATQTLALPKGLTAYEASIIGVAGYTAALCIHLLEEARVTPSSGEVVVNGATGGVSLMAIEMLNALGYSVVAVSSKADADAQLHKLGAASVMRSQSIPESTRPLETARWAGAIDVVGNKQLAWIIRTTKSRGAIACVGNAGGNELTTTVLPFIIRGIKMLGADSNSYDDIAPTLWARLGTDLKPKHLHEYAHKLTLDDLPARIQQMLAGKTTGRAVVAF